MSKSLVPRPDKAQGYLDEVKSQAKGYAVGVATAALAVPFLGWAFGLIAGGAAVVVWSVKSAGRKKP